ncbi:DUF1345 domain-containing protein [Mycolicibacterium palauense]|uniref:DUF1345 domain-containing protein n=1 Tax=Mycolicibacterium palauense TaxID=2034511 RepID=UPI000BFEF6F1|nr:DUF1345 domain-containing protein [Mycolicibacterium palauense]
MSTPEGIRDDVRARLTLAVLTGAAVGAVGGTAAGWRYAPTVGWVAAVTVYLALTWRIIGGLDAPRTKQHAQLGDSGLTLSEGTIVLASVASLAGVGHLLIAGASHGLHANIDAAVGVLSVVASWVTVHTVFTLLYARNYYDEDDGRTAGGIDFGTAEPTYADFAYLAFTIGMTYQVSDTTLTERAMRKTALTQGLLSYVLGAVVLAITINLVVSLSS